MSVQTKIIDHGWYPLRRDYSALNGSFTKVGVLSGEQRKDGKDGNLSEQVVVAAANEFGTKRIPERPFMRSTFDAQANALASLQKKMYADILNGYKKPKEALALIGEWYGAKVKRAIRSWETPPNALSTQKAKGKKLRRKGALVNNPLVDTGQLMQSIQHKEVLR